MYVLHCCQSFRLSDLIKGVQHSLVRCLVDVNDSSVSVMYGFATHTSIAVISNGAAHAQTVDTRRSSPQSPSAWERGYFTTRYDCHRTESPEWTAVDTETDVGPTAFPFTAHPGLRIPLSVDARQSEFFALFFGDDTMELLVEETNRLVREVVQNTSAITECSCMFTVEHSSR